jgi:hypothetical protein
MMLRLAPPRSCGGYAQAQWFEPRSISTAHRYALSQLELLVARILDELRPLALLLAEVM